MFVNTFVTFTHIFTHIHSLTLTHTTGRFLKDLRKNFQDKLAHANSTAEESISNVVTVRSFSNESKMTHLYGVDIDKSYQLGKKLAILTGKLGCSRVLVAWLW